MPLAATGLQVTLTFDSPGTAFHAGDFWMFAARPGTPRQVYPERLLTSAQPPSGPRLWACPLGVVTWDSATTRGPVGVQDCRHLFSPPTKLVFAAANRGAPVGPRNTLNFIGAGVAVADNPATAAIDVTVSGGAAGESSPTVLLFPYLTNAQGFDTKISISNTTIRLKGSAPHLREAVRLTISARRALFSQRKFSCFKRETRQITTCCQRGTAPTPRKITGLGAANFSNFQGYIIATCQFPGAYGFAMIVTPTGGLGSQGSYLAIVLLQRA